MSRANAFDLDKFSFLSSAEKSKDHSFGEIHSKLPFLQTTFVSYIYLFLKI